MDDGENPVQSESLARIRKYGQPPRSGFWAALIIGFGSLIVLIALSGFEALEKARTISGRISQAYQHNLAVEKDLADIRSQLQTSAILVRDYLLERSGAPDNSPYQRLEELRKSVTEEAARLENVPDVTRMRKEVELYWLSLEPIFKWTPEEKAARSSEFVKTRVPRRAAILEIVSQIETLNQQTLEKQRQEVELREKELPVFVRRSVILTILLGVAIAGLSLYWINRLEKISRAAHLEIERAGHELRELSQQLVHAQEEERKRLSHELHDEVGQLLTALRIELGNLDEPGKFSDEASRQRIIETKALAEQALRTVRDLAMGLRPAMLDELGLIPALEWQGREHSRRTGIPVSLEVEGELAQLPEEYRTCVYRVVQEALTNIAKHASARRILIGVRAGNDVLSISVKDDGKGFEPRGPYRGGMGLLGMAERVKKLGGELEVISQAGQGTSILAQMPLAKGTIDDEEAMRLVGG
jgi:signal transduction histidine kinase